MNKTVILMVFLILVLMILILLAKPNGEENIALRIQSGKKTVALTTEQLHPLMQEEIRTKRGSTWKGIYLSELLENRHVSIKKASKVVLSARDGRTETISIKEVSEKQAFLTYALSKRTGKNELKLIMVQDDFEQRWLKYVSLITVE